jgi:hypothetical protein
MSDAPLTDCPACGKPSFSKQLTAAGFQLKGSGWYATDFKGGAVPRLPAKPKRPLQTVRLPPHPPRPILLRQRRVVAPVAPAIESRTRYPVKRRIQHYFIAGLLVWLPLAITIWVLLWLVGMLDGVFLLVLRAIDSVVPGMHGLADRRTEDER